MVHSWDSDTFYVAETTLLTLIVLHLVLPNFANITLSSLYFDNTTDCIYSNDLQSVQEKSGCDYPCQSPQFYDCSSGPSAPSSDRGNPQNSS
ncbi:hypothetical protein M405DRAFT_824492 [Rhizopogon salebrosus TDB-379]|nr:hypothetical protein M405DRAFT_824492 [Rhizopogon salebrosus TDB-379]